MKRTYFALTAAATLAVFISACGGDDAADTTVTTAAAAEQQPADTATDATSAATEATTGATEATTGQISGLGDVPQECVDLATTFLQQIEPIVSSIDWANATIADLEGVLPQFEPLATAFEEAGQSSGCGDLFVDDAQSAALMTELAAEVAPGAVPYLTFVSSLAETETSGGVVAGALISGDCETDIATLQAIVAEGGTIADVPLQEAAEIAQLAAAIGTECPATRSAEVLSDPALTAYLSSIAG